MTVKVAVVGDDFIAAQYYVDAIARAGIDATVVTTALEGGKVGQHTAQQVMEFHGPNAVPCPPQVLATVADADVVCGHFSPFNKELIDAAPQLKLIAVARAGLENVDLDRAIERHIGVVPAFGRNASAVAELQIGLMLSETRNITRAHTSIVTGGWRKQFPHTSIELRDSVIGMVGLGHVGRSFASKVKGFGSDLRVYDPYLSAEQAAAEGVVKMDDLLELCRVSDFVLIQARLTPETERFFTTAHFAAMKPSAFFINCARSRLVDTQALIHALQTNQIAGAGLDVYDEEPLSADSPLRSLDNVSMTTHFGGDSIGTNITSADLVAKAIRAYLVDGSVPWAQNAKEMGWA